MFWMFCDVLKHIPHSSDRTALPEESTLFWLRSDSIMNNSLFFTLQWQLSIYRIYRYSQISYNDGWRFSDSSILLAAIKDGWFSTRIMKRLWRWSSIVRVFQCASMPEPPRGWLRGAHDDVPLPHPSELFARPEARQRTGMDGTSPCRLRLWKYHNWLFQCFSSMVKASFPVGENLPFIWIVRQRSSEEIVELRLVIDVFRTNYSRPINGSAQNFAHFLANFARASSCHSFSISG